MRRSARRMTLPELPEEDFLASLRALVEVDQAWVPSGASGESSLYLRPFMIANGASAIIWAYVLLAPGAAILRHIFP